MGLNFSIPSELVCSVISVGGVIVSALISKSVSKNTIAKEIEKMKLAWEREDLVSSEDDFSEMASLVARYTSGFYESHQRDALAKIASVRAKENGALAITLDELYQVVSQRKATSINDCLTKVIEAKRALKQNGASEPQKK